MTQAEFGDERRRALTNSWAIAERLETARREDISRRILGGLQLEEASKRTQVLEATLSDMCDHGDNASEMETSRINDGEKRGSPSEVRRWRAEEMKKMKTMDVYGYVPAAEARANPEAVIIDTTWVDDANKGKSRLCGREFIGRAVVRSST